MTDLQGYSEASAAGSGDVKHLIQRAALELFAQKGFDGTTTMAIAQKAKVSEKTLFKYFHTKQDLFDYTMHCCMQKVSGTNRELYPKDESAFALIRDLFLHKLRLADQNPDFLKIAAHECMVDPEFRTVLLDYWKTFFFPRIFDKLELSDEAKKAYGDALGSSLSLVILSQLIGFSFARTIMGGNRQAGGKQQIELILDILFNGINSLRADESKG